MWARTQTDLEDEIVQALLDHLRTRAEALPRPLTGEAILDPIDPEFENRYERAINGEGVGVAVWASIGFADGLTTTYSIAITVEVNRAVRTRSPAGMTAKEWAAWVCAEVSGCAVPEVVDGWKPVGVEDGENGPETELRVVRFETKTLTLVVTD